MNRLDFELNKKTLIRTSSQHSIYCSVYTRILISCDASAFISIDIVIIERLHVSNRELLYAKPVRALRKTVRYFSSHRNAHFPQIVSTFNESITNGDRSLYFVAAYLIKFHQSNQLIGQKCFFFRIHIERGVCINVCFDTASVCDAVGADVVVANMVING